MPVLRFFALQAAIGLALATLFLGVLLLADPGGIGTLLRPPGVGPLPAVLLWLFTGLTFGAVQFAAALGLAAEADPGSDRGSLSATPPGRPGRRLARQPAYAPVRARSRR
jgi:hypothetical protein